MRKVVLCDMISLDGYFEGPGEGWETIDWHRADDEWERYSVELLADTGTLLFGRRTYEGFADYWPTQEGELARMLNEVPKVVFSRTLERADWSGTRLVRDGASEEVARMKEEPGKDVVIFGSASFADTLVRDGLIDEYRLALNPVVLGGGSPLFKPGVERLNLRLAGTRTFASGIVLLTFTPDREARG
jgi:dihydrofolate reductase